MRAVVLTAQRRYSAPALGRPGVVAGLARLDHVGQRAPLDQLHREERRAGRLADAVDGHDVRVPQPCRRLGLALEAREQPAVLAHRGWQDLERHSPVQADLPRLVDHTHAAAAQLAQDLELAQAAGLGGPGLGRRLDHRDELEETPQGVGVLGVPREDRLAVDRLAAVQAVEDLVLDVFEGTARHGVQPPGHQALTGCRTVHGGSGRAGRAPSATTRGRHGSGG
jgi:hypothetical protein